MTEQKFSTISQQIHALHGFDYSQRVQFHHSMKHHVDKLDLHQIHCQQNGSSNYRTHGKHCALLVISRNRCQTISIIIYDMVKKMEKYYSFEAVNLKIQFLS